MNVWGSVHCKGVYSMGECTLGVQLFQLIIEIDQLEMTKSHMLNTSLKLTNRK